MSYQGIGELKRDEVEDFKGVGWLRKGLGLKRKEETFLKKRGRFLEKTRRRRRRRRRFWLKRSSF